MLLKALSVALVLVGLFHSTFQAVMYDPCPGGQVYNCFVDPCQFATCPNFPSAQCHADYCGGCFAKWYLHGLEVTDYCGSNTGKVCPIKGQVYMMCGSACPPTCANPTPFCTKQCVPGCQCVAGTVLDEHYNRCATTCVART